MRISCRRSPSTAIDCMIYPHDWMAQSVGGTPTPGSAHVDGVGRVSIS